MLNTFQDILTLSAAAGGTFDAYDLIGFDGKKVTSDDAPVMGVAKSPATVTGDMTAVMVIGAVRLKASGAITAGDTVVSAAAGGVKTGGSTPDNPFAVALNAAADGEFLDILIR